MKLDEMGTKVVARMNETGDLLEKLADTFEGLSTASEEAAINLGHTAIIMIMLSLGVAETSVPEGIEDVIDSDWLIASDGKMTLNLPEEYTYLLETKGVVR